MLKIKNLLILLVLFSLKTSYAQELTKAFEINEKLGRGINMGNMFEAPSETAWGNPYSSEYFPIISQLGFNHVRIPIRWEPEVRSSSNSPYEIYDTFLIQIKQVVDEALKNGLYAIINMHHHEELFEAPDAHKARFLAQWQQIGEYFKNYSDSLVFEVLNEPHGKLTSDKWNVFLTDALTEIRKNNPERIVLIGTASWGGISGLSSIQLPNDKNIILTVHYYDPFQFTHQGASWADGSDQWLGTKWLDTDIERESVINNFKPVVSFSNANNIPIHLGEFGSYSTADIESRERWTTYISRYMEELGFSWAYWEFSSGFGIYNPQSHSLNQNLVNALLNNKMPEPLTYSRTEIFNFNFNSGTEGWSVSNHNGASSNLSCSDGQLNLSIGNKGTEAWHIQILKNNLNLKEDKMYRVSFKAASEGVININSYVGKASSPWNAYSDYNGFQINDAIQEYAFYFTMHTTDTNARMVFDLGTSASPIVLDDIKLEELFLLTSMETEAEMQKTFYPNPVVDNLYLTQPSSMSRVEIYSIQGKKLMSLPIKNSNKIDLSKLGSGLYIAKTIETNSSSSFKFLKK